MNRKTYSKPSYRLMESTDIGPLLQKAGAVSFDEKRLERNRAELFRRLGSLSAKREGWFLLSLFPRRHVVFVAFAILVLSSVGAAAVFYLRTADTLLSYEAVDRDNRGVVGLKPSTQALSNLLLPQIEKEVSADKLDAASSQDAGLPSNFGSQGVGRRPLDKNPLSDSTLDDQVRLFNQAKARLASGDLSSALEHLNRLKKRYPDSPLSLESKELRAHIMAGLGRYREASQIAESLIRAKIPTRKKAQFYRFLGDMQVKQNRCGDAVESYRLALGLGLSGAESDAAKAGIRKCIP